MNLSDLRDELGRQADEIDGDVDLLPGARRRGRAARAVRIGAAAASVALVTAVWVMIAPDLIRSDGPAPAAQPAVAGPRKPLLSVIDSGQSIELSPGVRFTITGKNYRLTSPGSGGKPVVTNSTVHPPSDGEQGMHFGRVAGDRLHSMNIFPGKAVRVVYAVRLLGEAKATTYQADVYRLSFAPGWTMAYVTYPARGMFAGRGPTPGFEHDISITFTAYDASGKVIQKPTPR